jgi:hypothetical protein
MEMANLIIELKGGKRTYRIPCNPPQPETDNLYVLTTITDFKESVARIKANP